MGISKLDTLAGRPDFIKRFIKSHGKTEDDILAADSTETAASSRVAHQGWTIPAGGNGNPNAMRETIIAMNIGSDIGTDDDAGLGIGGGGGGGGGGVTYTTLYHSNNTTPNAGSHTHQFPYAIYLDSSVIQFAVMGSSLSGGMTDPGNEKFAQWSGYGWKDDGYGMPITGSNGIVHMCKIYSGTNAGFANDNYNLDGSWNFFCAVDFMEMMGYYDVYINFFDYTGAASNYSNGNPGPDPWASPGHFGYQLTSNYPNQPALANDSQGVSNDQTQKFFSFVDYYYNTGFNMPLRIDFAPPNTTMALQVGNWNP